MNPPSGSPHPESPPLFAVATATERVPRPGDRLGFYRVLASFPTLSTFRAKVVAIVLACALLPAFLLVLTIMLGAGRISALALIAMVLLCTVASALGTLWALLKVFVTLDIAAESIEDVALGRKLERVELPGSDTVAQILRGVQALVARIETLLAQAVQRGEIDELTGLLNRRAGRERAQALIDRETRQGRAVRAVVTDVNDFTAFNARHGTGQGDALLKRIATRVARVAGDAGIAVRWHGDTFLLVQPLRPDEGAEVETLLCRPIVVKGVEDSMTLASGSATVERRIPVDALVAEAEAALVNVRGASR